MAGCNISMQLGEHGMPPFGEVVARAQHQALCCRGCAPNTPTTLSLAMASQPPQQMLITFGHFSISLTNCRVTMLIGQRRHKRLSATSHVAHSDSSQICDSLLGDLSRCDC